MDEESEIRLYQPGKCNIGPMNRLFRFSYGFFFISLSMYLGIGFYVNNYSILAKAALILPFYVGFLGIYQALSRFCIRHARRRTYDMR
jgi:hypothetical protein